MTAWHYDSFDNHIYKCFIRDPLSSKSKVFGTLPSDENILCVQSLMCIALSVLLHHISAVFHIRQVYYLEPTYVSTLPYSYSTKQAL